MGTATHQIERALDGAPPRALLQWRHVLVLICLACSPMSCEDGTPLGQSGGESDTPVDTSAARSDAVASMTPDTPVDITEPVDVSNRQEVLPDTSSLIIEVSIEPISPTTLDSLKAAVVLPSGAAAPKLRYAWRRDGVLTANTGSILPASQTARGKHRHSPCR